ncbi:MAG: metal ABC transporter solute-binding protein, Zn/Mn family [Pseudoalteromonas spongiae]
MFYKIMFSVMVFCITLSNAYAQHGKLHVGTTLHPYYAYVANIVGNQGEVIPLIETGFNPHNYSLSPADIGRLKNMDALVVNGIGHDDFALDGFNRIKPQGVTLIKANDQVPLLRKNHKVNPHTFVSIDAAIRQVYAIAKSLGQLAPEHAKYFSKNAFLYAKKLRALKKPVQDILINHDLSNVRIASTHNAYGYLLQEFGLTVSAVVEPAHGVSPSASQLQQTINEIKKADIDVLFTELNMANSYVDVIEKATGIKVYHFSHMTHGQYSQDLVEREMKHNLTMLAKALTFAASKSGNTL